MRKNLSLNRVQFKGFTLLEVLVALVIVGLVLGGLSGVVSNQLNERHRMQSGFMAQTIAWNRLFEQYQLIENWTPRGHKLGARKGSDEYLGQTWHWQLEVQDTFGEDFYRYEVKSYLPEDLASAEQSRGSLVAYFVAD